MICPYCEQGGIMKVNGKIFQVNETEIELEYTIQKCIEYDNLIVILMYDETIIENNVLCFDKQGKELWKINDILNITRPTAFFVSYRINDGDWVDDFYENERSQ